MKINLKIQIKNRLYLIVALLPFFAIAQSTIELPSTYYLYHPNPRTGPYLIKNENVQLRATLDSIKQCSEEIQKKFYEKLSESEIAPLKVAKYHFKNKFEDFTFSINENGFLNGEAKRIKLKNTDYKTTLTFLNGVLIKTKTIIGSKNLLYSQSELKDFVVTKERFYNSGKLLKKEIEDLKIENQNNIVSTEYYENGNVMIYQNTIEGIYKAFTENGILKRHTDDNIGFARIYDNEGKLEKHSYKKGNENYTEYYTKGLLNKKEIISDKESREYFYKNGKMIYYEVYNPKTNEEKTFDSKNKLIPGKTIVRGTINY
jgi:hypothetical protein